MEDRFDNKDFERFVKQNADQYRMFPSEKVWNGVHHALHSRTKWYGLGIILLLLTAGIVTAIMFWNPAQKKQVSAVDNNIMAPVKNTVPEKKENIPPVIAPAVAKKNIGTESAIQPGKVIPATLFTDRDHSDIVVSSAQNKKTELLPPAVNTSSVNPAILQTVTPAPENKLIKKTARTETSLTNQKFAEPAVPGKNEEVVTTTPDNTENYSLPGSKSEEYPQNKLDKINNGNIPPYTIESVLNVYKRTLKRRTTTWQFYLMPTVSYRRLKENMNYIRAARSNGTISPNTLISYQDVNSVVNHKPDAGFELGFNAGFPITDNFRIIAGLQFNVSKYDIRAFSYQNELATIAIDASGANAVTAITPYRSFGAENNSGWLRNLYVSASAPVGVEVNFNTKKKVYSGFAATLQPTYVIDNEAYLLSTDFKNYAEAPSLTRRWNLNTSFEIFAGIPGKKVDWRIGPQVRYQTLSSFVDKYPVREHLFDFGIKLGAVLKH